MPAAARPAPLARVPAGLAAPAAATAARPRRRASAASSLATMLAAHGVAVVGLLNASRLRDAVADAKPMFLAVVDAPAPAAPPKPLPPPPSAKIPPPPR